MFQSRVGSRRKRRYYLGNNASTGDELLGKFRKALGKPNVVQNFVGELFGTLIQEGEQVSLGMPNAAGNIRDLALGG